MVVPKTNILNKKIFLRSGSKELSPEAVQAARGYIKNYWPQLERFEPKDTESLIGLPKPFLVPSNEVGHEFDFNEMFYWDSYFMVQGLLDEKHKQLNLGIVENMVFLFKRFGVIPNASRIYQTSRSHPPFFTSLILDVYNTYQMDKKWLVKNMKVAEAEYQNVWMGQR